jgi:beta-glucosidase
MLVIIRNLIEKIIIPFSERALREIYLKGFRIAIEESSPFALMTSYNLINGIHSSQNKQLLIDVLRSEWRYDGLIMSDWISSYYTANKVSKYPAQNSLDNIRGENNLHMGGGKDDYLLLINSLKEGKLARDDLLQCASKVYETIELVNN